MTEQEFLRKFNRVAGEFWFSSNGLIRTTRQASKSVVGQCPIERVRGQKCNSFVVGAAELGLDSHLREDIVQAADARRSLRIRTARIRAKMIAAMRRARARK